jgi:two-component system sensor histidine kinase UhpB
VISSRTPQSLFWRVFLINAALLAAAAVLLALSPATVSFPATAGQLLTLAGGVIALVAANAVLLRVSLRPLGELTQLMRRIDLLVPGQRLRPAGATELREVAAAFNEMLERLELERRSSNTRVVGRHEDERRRLAAELHDEIGQRLTALLLQLRTVIDDAPPELVPELLAIQALARDNLDEIGRLVRQLRPTVLDDLGLAVALHSLVDVAEQTTEVEFSRGIEPELPALAEAAELAVYRIAQEAITNVMRHADANRVEVAAYGDAGVLVLEVHDDGRGMLYAADQESGGIRGMRERAVAAGGRLSIDSRPGGGTSISVKVPAEA